MVTVAMPATQCSSLFMMARLRRRGWNNFQRRPRSDTLSMPKKYPENWANAMKLRRLLGGADARPAASDTIANVAVMAALRPLLRADPICVGTPDGAAAPGRPGNEIPAVLSRGLVVGSSSVARGRIF